MAGSSSSRKSIARIFIESFSRILFLVAAVSPLLMGIYGLFEPLFFMHVAAMSLCYIFCPPYGAQGQNFLPGTDVFATFLRRLAQLLLAFSTDFLVLWVFTDKMTAAMQIAVLPMLAVSVVLSRYCGRLGIFRSRDLDHALFYRTWRAILLATFGEIVTLLSVAAIVAPLAGGELSWVNFAVGIGGFLIGTAADILVRQIERVGERRSEAYPED